MSRFDKVLAKGSIVSRWLRMEEAKPFMEYIEEWHASAQKDLMTSRDVCDIHRAQGEVLVLRRILDMRQDILSYQKDVSSGKVKPVTSTQ